MSESRLVKALVAGTDGLLDNDVDVDNDRWGCEFR